jgi:hypothetical protein
LPARAEVQLLAGARAELGYPVRHLADGERLEMGEVVFEVLHTPGHTPEHISLLVTDRSRGEGPTLLLAGARSSSATWDALTCWGAGKPPMSLPRSKSLAPCTPARGATPRCGHDAVSTA